MKRNYYCLIAGLPDIVADEKKLIFSSVEFREMLQEGLSNADFELAKLYYLPFDHQNLLNFLYKKNIEWNVRGNYNKELYEVIGDRKSYENAEDIKLLPYLQNFIKQFYSEEGVGSFYKAELIITSGYYDYLSKIPNEFIKMVAEHDKMVSNVMSTLGGRKHEIDYENNLIGDDEIVSSIKKSRLRDFGISEEFPEIETLVQIYETENFIDREYKLDLYKWQYLDEITFFNYFTIEKILAYIQKLFIVERWQHLDKEKGQKMFNKILEELKSEFQLSDEFTITYGKKK